MDKFLEKYNLRKLNQEERVHHKHGNQNCNKKIFQQTKAQDQMASQVNSTKKIRGAKTYPTQTLPDNCRGR